MLVNKVTYLQKTPSPRWIIQTKLSYRPVSLVRPLQIAVDQQAGLTRRFLQVVATAGFALQYGLIRAQPKALFQLLLT